MFCTSCNLSWTHLAVVTKTPCARQPLTKINTFFSPNSTDCITWSSNTTRLCTASTREIYVTQRFVHCDWKLAPLPRDSTTTVTLFACSPVISQPRIEYICLKNGNIFVWKNTWQALAFFPATWLRRAGIITWAFWYRGNDILWYRRQRLLV